MVDASLLPVLLALVAASLFGLQGVLARRALRYVNAQTGAMVSICVAALIFWGLLIWRMEADWWRSPAVWVFASNGLLHPMLSMLLSFEANRRMGATVSATISATTPLFAEAGAVLWLGEGLSGIVLAGTLVIVGGIVVLSWQGGTARTWAPFALVFPIGAAMVRAFNHVWGRFGLTLLPAPLFAASLSFAVSGTLSVLAFGVRTGGLPRHIPRGGLLWGMLSGVCVSAAILCMYTALTTGQVVVVSPVLNTFPLFTLGWALLFRQERLTRRVAAGVVLVVAGVMLIGLRQV
ncbi:MAG TPA: DMT family transporter [bacterium]|nr:DMT family transporter [bacterium]